MPKDEKPARKRGRPTKYKPEYCELIKEYVGEKGRTLEQFAMKIKVHPDLFPRWAKRYPAFRRALDEANKMSLACWQRKLEQMMVDKSVNAPLVKLYFANRFNWRDKQDVSSDNKHEININIKGV